jgi:LysM repeat protein
MHKRLLLMALFCWGVVSMLQAQTSSTIPATHKVKKGETLYGIGRMYGMTVPQLEKMNPGIGVLQPGMKLNVLKTVDLPQTRQEPQSSPDPVYGTVVHTVQAGETLYALSRKYGVGVSEIKSANGLTSDVLSIGQRLNIPRQLIQTPAPEQVPVPSTPRTVPVTPVPDNRAGGMPETVRSSAPSRSMENKQWSGSASVNPAIDAKRPWVYFDLGASFGAAPVVVAVINPTNQQVLYCTVQGKPSRGNQLEVSQWVADRLGMVSVGAPVVVTYASPISE